MNDARDYKFNANKNSNFLNYDFDNNGPIILYPTNIYIYCIYIPF